MPNTQDVEDAPRQPEQLSTLLPSQYPPGSDIPQVAIETERIIRHQHCVRLIKEFRLTAAQRAHTTLTKNSKHRSTKNKNRTQAAMDKLTAKVNKVVGHYNHNFRQLLQLSPDAEAVHPLNEKVLGQGKRSAPWYWRVNINVLGSDWLSDAEVGAEFREGLRVQWFEAREHYKRWLEERQWLQHDAAAFQLTLASHYRVWEDKALKEQRLYEKAYCASQMAVMHGMLLDSVRQLESVLKEPESVNESYVERAKDI
ncbi:hypothetical protein FRC11_013588, partial [Ceratobasidium sp. 423]